MARAAAYRGITARPSSVLVEFQYDGRRRETLGITPTAAGLQRAARIKQEIENAILLGTFTLGEYARYFPDSPYLKAKGYNAVTDNDDFQAVATLWLQITAGEREGTTQREYTNALKRHFYPKFGARKIAGITYEELARHLAETGFQSPKTFNNIMTPARGVFAWALKTRRIREDPTKDIPFRELAKPLPDPFTLDEVELILPHIEKTYGAAWHNYFEVAFFSGMRPSEQIALTWPKVDLRRGELRIDAARVRTIDKGTKTGQVRDIELPARALAALTRQKAVSFLAHGHVFLNPATGAAFADTSAPQEKILQPTLKRLGIRQRDARHTRHTFATFGLMAGNNPAYMARQLGQSLEIFFTVYAKWIHQADSSRERSKMDAFTAQAMPQTDRKKEVNE